jgi:hypothetical protein
VQTKHGLDSSLTFSEFKKEFEPLETELVILTDQCTGALFCECHVSADKLIRLGTTHASLDADHPEYKANREVDLNHQAFKRMKQDATKGRTFSNIVAEYRKDDDLAHPLKIIGGQHRFEAIQSALPGRNEHHGVKVYFDLNTDQRADVALISNTNIAISKDLIDRIQESVTGGQLRSWCQSIGLLKPGQQFTDKYKRGGAISVQMARTFVTNYYKGKGVSAKNFKDTDTTAEKCPAGQLYDEGWAQLESQPNLLTDPGLGEAAKEFTNLIKKQREAFAGKTPRPRPDFPEKALNLAVLAAWAWTAGHLHQNAKRLHRHYALVDAKNHDPLNAAALAQGKHKKDGQNYRGLGYRTDPKERGRLVELFAFQAEKGDGINKHAIEVAISEYEAKQSQLAVQKIRNKEE